MHYETLLAIRDRLISDITLGDFAARHYPGARLRFFIGARVDDRARDDYPYIAISPMREERPAGPDRRRAQKISLMFGVADDEIVSEQTAGGVPCESKAGLLRIAELGELIQAALTDQPLGRLPWLVTWSGEATTDSDAGIFHPYYEGEMVLPITLQTTRSGL